MPVPRGPRFVLRGVGIFIYGRGIPVHGTESPESFEQPPPGRRVGQRPQGLQAVAVSTGVPHLQEDAPPEDPTVGLCLGSWGNPREMDVLLRARYPCRYLWG